MVCVYLIHVLVTLSRNFHLVKVSNISNVFLSSNCKSFLVIFLY